MLAKRFGNPGRRIWYMAQGADPEPVQLNVPPPRTMGHGEVMPPNTKDESVILTYLVHMSEKVAARLQHHQMVAQTFAIGLNSRAGWIGWNQSTPAAGTSGVHGRSKLPFRASWKKSSKKSHWCELTKGQ